MEEILKRLVDGEITIDEASDELKIIQIQEIGDNIKFDSGRKSRLGVGEAVYAQGKSDDDLLSIINNIELPTNLMITRLDKERFDRLQNQINEDILSMIREFMSPKGKI